MQQRSLLALLLSGIVLGCTPDTTAEPATSIEGTYSATTFTVVISDIAFDLLKQGITLSLTLEPDGSTSGTQNVAGTVTDLTGQWDTSAHTLHLHLPTQRLLTESGFAIEPDRLRGDPVLGSFAFHLTLTRRRPRVV